MANKFPLILNTSANQIQEIASGDNLDLTGCKIVGLQGINSAGIVTFTKAHVGAGTTWGEDLVVTGNARVTGILTVGTNSVVINGNDVNITGVTTASNFKTGTSNLHNVGIELAGINVLGADTPIGTGATIYDAGGAVFTGVVTATNYVGTINTPAQPNITSLGTLSSLDVSGNVSIGGTLTYEDVTNVDAVGLITARAGVNISDTTQSTSTTTGALKVAGGVGIVKNLNVGGNVTFNGNDNVVAGNYLDIQDGKKLRLGTDGDLSLYHQGGANFIKNSSSQIIHIQTDASIRFNSTTGSHNILIGEANGPVKLFFNNSNKIETTNVGAVVTGILTATQVRYSGGGNQYHGHSRSVVIGYSGSDYAQLGMGWVTTGTNGQYTSANTDKQSRLELQDGLTIFGSGVSVTSGQTVTWKEVADFKPSGITLYNDTNPRLTTTSSGVNFTGTDYGFGTTPGGNPAAKAVFLAIGDSDTGIVQDGDGQLELWANNNEVANFNAIDGYTSTKPITTTGDITASGGAGAITVSANSDIRLANGTWTGEHCKLQHHSNNLYIQGGSDGIRFRNTNGSRQLAMDNDGHFGPNNSQTYNLGSSSLPWTKLFATSATFYDNGAPSPIVDIRSDDGSPWHLQLANDNYSTTAGYGLNLHLDNSGKGYIRNMGASTYNHIKIGVNDGTGGGGTVDTLIVDQNGISVDGNSGISAKRLTLVDNGGTGPIFKVRTDDNSPWALEVGNDTYSTAGGQMWYQNNNGDFYQRLQYTNAGFRDWHFQVTDGISTNNAITIDTNRAVTLLYQGNGKLITHNTGVTITGTGVVSNNLRVGVNGGNNEVSAFTNHDAGNSDFSHRGGRTLHSNGTGWDGSGSTDGCDPMIVCSVADRAGNSDIGDSLGLLLHSESMDNDDYSPLIAFSSRSNSTNYNSIYAAIAGRRTGQGADANWNAGQLNFYTAGKNSNRASDQYMDNIPDFFIDRHGFTGTPRNSRFRAWKTGSNWSVGSQTAMVWDNTVYNIGGDYNTGNGRYYAPVNGFYHFNFYSITYGQYTNGCVYCRINGNRQNGGDVHYSTHASNWEWVCWNGTYELTAGQYVDMFNCNSATYHGGTWSTFEGHLVSSEAW